MTDLGPCWADAILPFDAEERRYAGPVTITGFRYFAVVERAVDGVRVRIFTSRDQGACWGDAVIPRTGPGYGGQIKICGFLYWATVERRVNGLRLRVFSEPKGKSAAMTDAEAIEEVRKKVAF
jgi:hypothetical protein